MPNRNVVGGDVSSSRGRASERFSQNLRAPRCMRINLLHQFRVIVDGQDIALPVACEHLVAVLVLQDRPCARQLVAAQLWPDRIDRDAATMLRRALWRLNRDAPGLLESDSRQVAVDPSVEVDLKEVDRLADAVQEATAHTNSYAVRLLEGELLPQWSEPWLEAPRESLRQVRLHTLEALARNDLDGGRPGSALTAALAAASLDPLRESPHRIVVAAHLAEGNTAEALRHYMHFRELLWAEMGLRPSSRLESMLTEGGHVVSIDARRSALNA